MAAKQPHIVIIGGAYGGLAALNSMISLSKGLGYPEGKKRPGPPGAGAGRGGRGGAANGSASQGRSPPAPVGPPNVSRALRTKPRYTVLDERDGFYHTVGAPLGQISPPHAQEFWVKFDEMKATKYSADDVNFVQGSASELDLEARALIYTSTDGRTKGNLSYDFLVVASGMSRGWPVVPKSFDYDTYIEDAKNFEEELKPASKVAVIGGGACGIEMSAELKVHWPEKEIILIHSRGDLLSREPLSDEFKSIALQLVKEQGVDVKLNTRLHKETGSGSKRVLELSTGEALEVDRVIYTAVQQGANTEFLPKSALDDQGCVLVRSTFQFPILLPNADIHYAIGDAAHWPSTIKRSGPAMSQGKYAASNIITQLIALEDGKSVQDAILASCPESAPTMTLAVGEQAMTTRNGVTFGRQIKMGAFGTGLGIDGTLANLGLRPRRQQEVGKASGATEDVKIVDGERRVAATASM